MKVNTVARAQQVVSAFLNVVVSFGKMAPVRIVTGRFGATRDLLVSQDHPILCEGPRIELMFETQQVLVATRHLVGRARRKARSLCADHLRALAVCAPRGHLGQCLPLGKPVCGAQSQPNVSC